MEELLHRVARIARPNRAPSIVMLAASSFGVRPSEESTVPTGFDPLAAALFEAIVEAGYLVASADGIVDADERSALEGLVLAMCGGTVAPSPVRELLATVATRLSAEGIDARVDALRSKVKKADHARELLRLSSLIALASQGLSADERAVLERLAAAFGLQHSELEELVAAVTAEWTKV